MSDELNAKHERFCQAIISGMSQRDAYKAAGFRSTNDNAIDACASRLLSTAKITSRIAELRKPAAKKARVTLDWLIEQAQEVLQAAKQDGSHAASIAAIKELGILTGERVETRQNLNQDINDTSELSRAELVRIARAGRAGTAEAGSGAGKPDSVHPVH